MCRIHLINLFFLSLHKPQNQGFNASLSLFAFYKCVFEKMLLSCWEADDCCSCKQGAASSRPLAYLGVKKDTVKQSALATESKIVCMAPARLTNKSVSFMTANSGFGLQRWKSVFFFKSCQSAESPVELLHHVEEQLTGYYRQDGTESARCILCTILLSPPCTLGPH